MGLRWWILGFSASVGLGYFRLGEWDRVAAVFDAALAEEPEPEDRAALLSGAAMVPTYRGEDVSALLDEIEQLVGPSTDRSLVNTLLNARGAAALVDGRLTDAQAAFHVAAEATLNDTDARLLAARAALWLGDLAGAGAELATLDASGFRTPVVEARGITIRAGLAAVEGRRPEALQLYREVMSRWRELGLVVDEALTGVDMALLLDAAEPDVREAADAARQILVRLGATPFIALVDAALVRPAGAPRSADSAAEGAPAASA